MKLFENPCAFANSPVDRAAHLRGRPDELMRLKAAPTAKIALFHKLQPFVQNAPNPREIKSVVWVNAEEIAKLVPEGASEIFLGLEDGEGRFAIDISAVEKPAEAPSLAGRGQFAELRMLGGTLPVADAAMLAQAKALIDWHSRHKFCANCGAPTEVSQAGYQRNCPSCKSQHFPRTDPAVIMLATHGEEALLGRGKQWPPTFLSTLAGFVEPGETIEEAVARELYEEAGVVAEEVHYMWTQPWPFPASLMIGCIAAVKSKDLKIDPEELAEARWIPREELKLMLAGAHPGKIGTPPPFAVAHQLMKAWTSGNAP